MDVLSTKLNKSRCRDRPKQNIWGSCRFIDRPSQWIKVSYRFRDDLLREVVLLSKRKRRDNQEWTIQWHRQHPDGGQTKST